MKPSTSKAQAQDTTASLMAIVTSQEKCINELRLLVVAKEEKIIELESQLDKFKSVLSVNSASLGQPRRTRMIGVSAEAKNQEAIDDILKKTPEIYPKTLRTKQLIMSAIYDNVFLKNLTQAQIEEITLCMFPITHAKDSLIIREGDVGSVVFVMEEGKVEVSKLGKKLLTIQKPGSVFGELAILYNCTRTATIRALTDCKLWCIERPSFQHVIVKSGLKRQEDYIEFLKTVQPLSQVGQEALSRVASSLEEASYNRGAYIIRQGSRGDTFYIIHQGQVKVNVDVKDEVTQQVVERTIRYLKRGDYFGERALQGEDVRTASVIADDDNVVCLVIDRYCFEQFIGQVEVRNLEEENPDLVRTGGVKIEPEYQAIELADVKPIATLGMGGFGRVDLVTIKNDTSKSFALKILKKCQIVQTKQEQHIINERNIMLEIDCPFIVKMHRTFRDERFVYMLLEVCLGGELWTVLRDRRRFDEDGSRFYTACVIEAFSYLHSRQIIYRDLKPENMLIDQHGYVKLTDFGFAKRLSPPGSKTWTFCGTPDYVSPEVILNRGHDCGVDFWSLGVLMFELLTGAPPFTSDDPMKTYNLILRGIDAVDFPRTVSPKAHSLIKKLCRDNLTERLGYQRGGVSDIIKHKWFDGFDWNGLRDRTMIAPYVPRIQSPIDCSNFDSYAPDEEDVPIDLSPNCWDKEF